MREYLELVRDVLNNGQRVKTRNGYTRSVFAKTLVIDMEDGKFPLLQSRKIHYKGVLGEMAAFLRGPKTIKDFEDQGCNYWKNWGNDDGTISVDYGNLWRNFGGVDQLSDLIQTLRTNPSDRRLLISGWKPDNLDSLSLPCCHILYQWYVREGGYLDMVWYQRSADTMIGIPSDIVLAALFNILLANEVGFKPGKITMVFGDTHIYEEHLESAKAQLERAEHLTDEYPNYYLSMTAGQDMTTFSPNHLSIENYNPMGAISYELK